MRNATVSLCLILCLLFCTLAGRSFSQTQGPKSPEESQRWFHEQRLKEIQRQADFQRKMEEQRFQTEERQKAARKIRGQYADEAWQEALGATAEQWKAIKPKLERIRQLRSMPSIDVSVYAFSGAGSSHADSFSFSEGSGGGGGSTARSGHLAGSMGGSGGAGGGGHAFGEGAGGANGTGQAAGAARGTWGTSLGGGATGSTSGYGFSAGGVDGPVKKQVGDMSLGWQWRRPSLTKEPDKLTAGERACEQLLDVLAMKNPDVEQVRQHVEALRKVREQLRVELQETQRQLREMATPEQEAKLILAGYLD